MIQIISIQFVYFRDVQGAMLICSVCGHGFETEKILVFHKEQMHSVRMMFSLMLANKQNNFEIIPHSTEKRGFK